MPPPSGGEFTCTIPTDQIFDGGPGKDGIPALTDPFMTVAGSPDASYLDPEERVIGIVLDGNPVAIPHRVLWNHEIVNLNVGEAHVAVTYCPLTGTSMAFDRSILGGAELGVSGLLFQNNLIMYDRRTEESLWPQMLRGAKCGASTGTQLSMVPVVEMTWQGWTELHPDTEVPAQDFQRGQNFAAYRYPYGNYEEPGNASTLFPMPSIDTRRPPKERVLGVPTQHVSEEGIAFPFGELESLGLVGTAHGTVGGRAVVVFWDGAREAAIAFEPTAAGLSLDFEIRQGAIVDLQTESTWTTDGRAEAGTLEGERLQPIAEAYVAFWFAWAAFHPRTLLWDAG